MTSLSGIIYCVQCSQLKAYAFVNFYFVRLQKLLIEFSLNFPFFSVCQLENKSHQ